MTLVRTVEPSAEPVTLAEMKAHLRVQHSSEDALLEGLIRAARQDVERATGLALIDQAWRLVADGVSREGGLSIPLHPVREILSITVYGSEGEASLVDAGSYQADLVSRPARLYFDPKPERLKAMNGIEVDFTAGFGEAGTDVPDPLRLAIKLLAGHWYEFRGAYGPGDQPVSYPGGYDRLISHYRTRRL